MGARGGRAYSHVRAARNYRLRETVSVHNRRKSSGELVHPLISFITHNLNTIISARETVPTQNRQKAMLEYNYTNKGN